MPNKDDRLKNVTEYIIKNIDNSKNLNKLTDMIIENVKPKVNTGGNLTSIASKLIEQMRKYIQGNGLFTSDKNDVLAVKPKSSLTKDIKDAIELISVNSKETIMFGSFIYKSQLYPSDIDLIENVTETGTIEEATEVLVKKIQKVIKNIVEQKAKGTYLGDVKAGMDTRYYINVGSNLDEFKANMKLISNQITKLYGDGLLTKNEFAEMKSHLIPDWKNYFKLYFLIRDKWILRWTQDELLAGYKLLPYNKKISLQETFVQNTHVKIDMWTPINGKYIEVTNLYALFQKDSKGNINLLTATNNLCTLFEDIKRDVRKLYFSEDHFNPFKICKRMWSMARLIKDYKMIDLMTPILQSDAGRLSETIGEIETVLLVLINVQRRPLKILNKQVDELKQHLANVYEIDIMEEKIDEQIDKIVKTPNVKIKINGLQHIKMYLKKILFKNTIAYLNEIHLWPPPNQYLYDKYTGAVKPSEIQPPDGPKEEQIIRAPLDRAEGLVGGSLKLADVNKIYKTLPTELNLTLVGSASRKKKEPNDIDLLSKGVPLSRIKKYFEDKYKITMKKNGKKYIEFDMKKARKTIRFNIWYSTKSNYELFYFWLAYPGTFNQRVRHAFKSKGWELSQNELINNKGKKVRIKSYKDIFTRLKKLGFNYPYRTPEEQEFKAGSFITNAIETISDIPNRIIESIKGPRKGFPPSVRKMIEKYKDHEIVEIGICRDPIQSTIKNIVRLLTLDTLSKQYDEYFHLYLILYLSNGDAIRLEKNHVITMANTTRKHCDKSLDIMQSSTVGNFIENAVKKVGSSIYHYNAETNNCQIFVLNLLQANNLLTIDLKDYIQQDIVKALSTTPGISRKIINFITNLAERGDILIQGKGKGGFTGKVPPGHNDRLGITTF